MPKEQKERQSGAKDIRLAMESETAHHKDVTIGGLPARLRSLTAYEAEHYRMLHNSEKPEEQALAPAKMVQMSLEDRDGNPVYTRDEVKILAGRQDAMLMPLYYQALQLNGMTPGSMVELAKNLLAIAGDFGESDSPANTDAASPSCSEDTANEN